MKKLLVASLCLLPTVNHAITEAEKEIFRAENIRVLKEKGYMTPDSGVELVPRAALRATHNVAYTKPNKEGYYNESSPRAHELLHFKEVIRGYKTLEAPMNKPYESHMRYSIDEMPMAYTLIGVPQEVITEFIGIAPSGAYLDDPIQHVKGWSGAVEFFKTSFATCAYTESNLYVSHGAARIAEEEATNDVNGKITLIDTSGNPETGYLYRIKWFDNFFIRELECANMTYSIQIKEKVINLANIIDKK